MQRVFFSPSHAMISYFGPGYQAISSRENIPGADFQAGGFPATHNIHFENDDPGNIDVCQGSFRTPISAFFAVKAISRCVFLPSAWRGALLCPLVLSSQGPPAPVQVRCGGAAGGHCQPCVLQRGHDQRRLAVNHIPGGP